MVFVLGLVIVALGVACLSIATGYAILTERASAAVVGRSGFAAAVPSSLSRLRPLSPAGKTPFS